MKFLSKSLIILLVSIFASCGKDKVIDSPEPEPDLAVSNLKTPTNGATVILIANGGSTIFGWEASKRSEVSYLLAFDKTTGNFSNPVHSVNTNDKTSVSVTHAQLDEIAGKMGIEPGKSGTFKWTVFSSKDNESAKAERTHTIAVRRLDEVVLPCEGDDCPCEDCGLNPCVCPHGLSSAVYIVGEGTEIGSNSNDDALMMKRIAARQYEIYMRLEAGKTFRFIDNDNGKGRLIYWQTNGVTLVTTNGTGGGTVAKTAIYKLFINTSTERCTISEIDWVALMHNWSQMLFPLEYQGFGKWALYDYGITGINDNEMDDRYKFRMRKIVNGSGTITEWRTAVPNDWKPDDNRADKLRYYEMVEKTDVEWWTNNQIWKNPSTLGWNLQVYDCEFILKPDIPYRHTFTVKGVMPKPDNWIVPSNWAAEAEKLTQELIKTYWAGNDPNPHFREYSNGSGGVGDIWPQAHSLDVIWDQYIRKNGDINPANLPTEWLRGVRARNNASYGNGWANPYIDDMEWIALSALRGYALTGNNAFLTPVKDTWYGTSSNVNATNGTAGIKNAWTTTGHTGGGIFWNASTQYRTSKNACSNAPAAILAARLYRLFKDTDHPDFGGVKAVENLEMAKKIFKWQRDWLFAGDGGILDNINDVNGAVSNAVFSYNLGTWIGAAVELYQITGERQYLNDAIKSATYTIERKSNLWGILNASGNDDGTGDGSLFNGILVRYFAQLILCDGLDETNRQRFISYLKGNGVSMLNAAANPKYPNRYGSSWTKPIPDIGGNITRHGRGSQVSACMLIEALALLEKEGKLN